ncbi:MAG: glycosyltransferase family 4 protein [Pseudomonadota bacterium]|nr:glycosyltransferase family 4 protein [Pseudomonadota bacterium]
MLRIALTADPEIEVPPRFYGGIERVVDMLAHSLTEAGHDVTLFAHPASRSAGRLVAWPGSDSRSVTDTARNMATLAREVARGRFDLVHSFSRIAYMLPILPFGVPKLMTYQREISRRSISLGHRLSRGTLWFSAIGHHMMRSVGDIGTWRMVPNGVPLRAFSYSADPGPDAPLCFLGRIEEIKGPHLAIRIAKASGVPLVIAGNIPDAHRSWYEREVAPHIDGRFIRYVGPVDDVQKNALLGRSRAFLMPILWEEPFGIVMAEALACGTPVLGLRRGAVPEIVEDGVSGFVTDTVEELVACVARLPELDRAASRRRAETRYSDTAVAAAYLGVYREMMGRT